jgi:hypothetical protein
VVSSDLNDNEDSSTVSSSIANTNHPSTMDHSSVMDHLSETIEPPAESEDNELLCISLLIQKASNALHPPALPQVECVTKGRLMVAEVLNATGDNTTHCS